MTEEPATYDVTWPRYAIVCTSPDDERVVLHGDLDLRTARRIANEERRAWEAGRYAPGTRDIGIEEA